MPFGQLNPMRTIAPQQSVTTGALANILGQQNDAFSKIGTDISNVGNVAEEYGRNVNTGALNDLIASGQLDGLNEADIQQLVSSEAGGMRQSPEGASVLEGLIGNARNTALAETQHSNKLSELIQKSELDDISRAKDQLFELQKMDKQSLIDTGLFEQKSALEQLLQGAEIESKKQIAGDKLSQELFSQDKEIEANKKLAEIKAKSDFKIAEMKLGASSNTTGLEKHGIDKIMAMENPIEQSTMMVETILEDKNLFQDAKFDEPTEMLVKGAVQKAMETPEGQSAFATGDRDVIMGVIKKQIPNGKFASVASGFGALNPFGRHFLDTNKQIFTQGE